MLMMINLSPEPKKCIFLGYAHGMKGYRLWCLALKSPNFIISKAVTFDESVMLHPRRVLLFQEIKGKIASRWSYRL